MVWTCPQCDRQFRQTNQRHRCGTGDRVSILRNRPAELVNIFEVLERMAHQLGGVEIVTRDRYALFRTTRIFADLTVTKDAVRLVLHLNRRVQDDRFIKVVAGKDGRVSHVVKLTETESLRDFLPLFEEAHALSIDDG